ncbi:MAG: hypothetical protein HKN98_10725 [Silicimonas sp.]|nr:hypothetical protein [Silicimonas sp.]
MGARYGLLHNTGGGLMVPSRHLVGLLLRGDTGAGNWGEDAMQWADIDGDGDLDAIAGGNSEPLSAQINQEGRFATAWTMNRSALNIVNTDVERDGDVDLIVAHTFCATETCGGPVQFSLLINDGYGGMSEDSAARGLHFGDSDYISGVVSGDIDRDGDFDIVLAHGGTRGIEIAFNVGTGNYILSGTGVIAIPGSGFGQGMNLGDIDDDGDLDLMIGRGDDTYRGGHPVVVDVIAINNGAGALSDDSVNRWYTSGETNRLGGENASLVDIDYDGDLDWVSFHKDNVRGQAHLQVFLNDGVGNFIYQPKLSPRYDGTFSSGLGSDVDVADIDGDGVYDIWVGISGANVRPMINTWEDPSGLRANIPRNLTATIIDNEPVLEWDPPPFASIVRGYRVFRATSPGVHQRDKLLIREVTISRFQDEGFVAPLTRHTRASEIGDPQVEILANGGIRFTDKTALAGETYFYSVAHVGTENSISAETEEVAAMVPPSTMKDTAPPVLDIVHPTKDHWTRYPRIVLLYADGGVGIDPASLHVSFDQPLGNNLRAPGENLADLGWRHDDGVFILPLEPPFDLPPVGNLVTLTVRVSDNDGRETIETLSFFPRHDPIEWPLAKFTFQTDRTEAPVTVDLDASESSDTDGAVMRYEWYFDDGTTALGRHTQKVFDKDGNWEIKLLVRDDHGAVAAYTDAITVGE